MPDLSHSPSNEEFERIRRSLADHDDLIHAERERWEELFYNLLAIIEHVPDGPRRLRKALGLATEDDLRQEAEQEELRRLWAVRARRKECK